MGYYSEVGLVLTQSGIDTLKDMLSVQDEQTKLDIQTLLHHADKHEIDIDTGAEVWYWKQCRWNDESDDPEILFMERLLKKLSFVEYCFIRLGCDFEDTDIRGYFWDNPFGMNVTSSIIFNKTC